jgi:primosomal protein N' (replication factor Y) (superfamily II helicase)
VRPGARVVVPLRQRELIGVVLETDVPAPEVREPLKAIIATPDPKPAVSEPLLRLIRWVADYYGAPFGLALKSALPGALWGASRVVARLAPSANPGAPSAAAQRAPAASGAPGFASAALSGRAGGTAAEVLQILADSSDGLTPGTVSKKLRRPAWDALQRLERMGLVTLDVEPADAGPKEGAERVIVLTESLPSLVERERAFKRSKPRRAAFELIEGLGGAPAVSLLTREHKISPAVLRGLVDANLARFESASRPRDPFSALSSDPPIRLSAEQSSVVSGIASAPVEKPCLLFGVTGSGKTAVYLEALKPLIEAGKGAVILVPEISLTPQTVARVRGVFGDQVAVLHSGLSDAERADAWRELKRGKKRVAIGARSAVFAPVEDLGAIVVDEEHEGSYKHGETPRYHARDVAAVRAQLEGARLILGSATPSLESLAKASSGEYVMFRLPERIGARPLPRVRLVDLREQPRGEWGVVPWSAEMDSAVEGALQRGEQAILLLNRRGFSTFLQCPACGDVPQCPNCSISLTVHRVPESLRCHYCGRREAVLKACAKCGHEIVRALGLGTQQLEQFVSRRFPAARIARMDLDTTGTKWAHHRILDRVAARDVDVLLGTQMIAKGLDFPDVTVVGVVDADVGLHLPDFRAAERTFQLVAQVAGRAGRGPKGGVVVVQTRQPEHHALTAASQHSVEQFAERELEVRRNPPYPPFVSLVRFVVSGAGSREQGAVAYANRLAQWLGQVNAEKLGGALEILGPAPCPIMKIKNRVRWHIVVKATDPKAIGRVVRAWATRDGGSGKGVDVQVERDPVGML